jgi:hypothetical protein
MAFQLLKRLTFFLLLLTAAAVLRPVALSAQAVAGATFYPIGLTFFDQQIGTTSPTQIVMLLNSGTAPLTLTKRTVTGNFTASAGCTTIAPGSSCRIVIAFAPTALGLRTGTLSFTDNAPNSPQVINLSGNGISSGATLVPSSLAFNPQVVNTKSGIASANLINNSTATITISSIVASSGYAVTSNCGASLTPGGLGCLINVTFAPTSTGSQPGTVTITDSAAGSPHTLNLTGMGASPEITVFPNNFVFAAQTVGTTSAAKKATVTNTGSSPVDLVNITASGDFGQTNTCGASLAPQAQCVVSITFTPSASGARGGRLNLLDTDPTNLQTAFLSGTGTVPASTVTISPITAAVTPTENQQFQASISGTVSTAINWAVDGISGGNASVGTISTSGLYTPPSTSGSHSVTATSTANPTQSAAVLLVVTDYSGVFTYHNDNARTGQNLNETVLTTGNVNSSQFGRLFSLPVDGKIYAQPLYVASVDIPGQGFHNVVYVATENDSVYAYDADGLVSTPLWQKSYIPTGYTAVQSSSISCFGIAPTVGITGTPVINPASNTMYFVARVQVGTPPTFFQYLHAVSITTGADNPGSPVLITPSVPGTGVEENLGTVTLDPKLSNQRAGLVLSNGVVYIAWGSTCDAPPYHGWVAGYNAETLDLAGVFNTTPNGQEAGVWQGGAAPAVDANGNIFFSTGNGTFDASFEGTGLASAFVELSTTGGLTLAQYFSPYNADVLDAENKDLSSAGVLLLPDQTTGPPHLLLGGGKPGTIYLVNRDNMGGFDPNGDVQVVQELVHGVGLPGPTSATTGIWGMPAYYQNQVYYAGVADSARAFSLINGLLSPTAITVSSATFTYPGATPSISANGNSNGIVWLLSQDLVTNGTYTLLALDAANLSKQLYTSAKSPAGGSVQFAVPTVANGKVFVGTGTNPTTGAYQLDVFGLLPALSVPKH